MSWHAELDAAIVDVLRAVPACVRPNGHFNIQRILHGVRQVMLHIPGRPREPVGRRHVVSALQRIRLNGGSPPPNVPISKVARGDVSAALISTSGRVGPAAKMLGVQTSTVYRAIVKFDLGDMLKQLQLEEATNP